MNQSPTAPPRSTRTHRDSARWQAAGWARVALLAMVPGLLTMGGEARASSPNPWQVAGRQGIVQIVLVPAESVTDLAAYRTQIMKLCLPEQTCFINFFANASGLVVELPLPESIAAQATARYRRSAKNGVELFQWSCRLGQAARDCF